MLRAYTATTRLGLRQYARHRLLIILLLGLPFGFITLSYATSPDVPIPFTAPEAGRLRLLAWSMPEFHATIMVPITVAFVSALGGLFIVADGKQADWRIGVAGMPPLALSLARITILLFFVTAVTLISVGVALLGFRPQSTPLVFVANLEVGLVYGGLGAVVGALLGRLGGTYVAFIVPMLDVGLIQNPMFPRDALEWWAKLLPGWAPTELLIDVSFTPTLDRSNELWIAAVTALLAIGVAAAILHRQVRPRA